MENEKSGSPVGWADVLRATLATKIARPSVRPGQMALGADIDAVINGPGGRLVGQAPTGVGKSLAILAPAVVAAAQGRRTLISTQSLHLQSQILTFDAPAVSSAAAELFGGWAPRVAVLKGWSNHVCHLSAADELTAAEASATMLGADPPAGPAPDPGTGEFIARVGAARAAWEKAGQARRAATGADEWTPGRFDTLAFAARAAMSTDPADAARSEVTGEGASADWARVSRSPDVCAGGRCPFAKVCFPRAARAEAAGADIVVTNHALLGVQAAHRIPVVLSSPTLGTFETIVVDEAHALVDAVRSQTRAEIGVRRVRRQMRRARDGVGEWASMHNVVPGPAGPLEWSETTARTEDALARFAAFAARHAELAGRPVVEERVEPGADPLGSVGVELADALDGLAAFCGQALADAARRADRVDPRADPMLARAVLADHQAYKRLASGLERLREDLGRVRAGGDGAARWASVQPDQSGRLESRWHAGRIDVSGMIDTELWHRARLDDDPDEDDADLFDRLTAGPPRPEERVEMRVVCVSATLPEKTFCAEAGLAGQPVETYASPFGAAMANSAVWTPKPSRDDLDVLCAGPGRRRMDTTAHAGWAAPIIADLVEANAGHALVLAATTRAGRDYARLLADRARGWAVYSQWDFPTRDRAAEAWRAEAGSVLVGTRGLMTGVDAPGEACSLVVIDRVPRAAGNAVDDARVRALGLGRWPGDTAIYVGDAATLLAQAAGRLIRSGDDSGMVAVLDPRLRRSSPIAYKENTRTILMGPLRKFGNKLDTLDDALAWLENRAAERKDSTDERR